MTCPWNGFIYLFEHLHRDSAPGYIKPDLTAILRADRQAWIVMAEQCHDFGLQADGSLPLDQLLGTLKTHPDVAFNLLPLPNTKRAVSGGSSDTKEKEKESSPPTASKGKGKSKSKSKGKGKTRRTPMPTALQGQWSTTSTGQPICFDFNLPHGCSKAPAGGKLPQKDSCMQPAQVWPEALLPGSSQLRVTTCALARRGAHLGIFRN